MKIIVDMIPHKEQDYETVGNWKFEYPDTLHVFVSQTGDQHYDFLVSVHEIIEAYLCYARGISQKQVDDFDMKFEANRKDDSEPGDDPKAPYKREHCIATGIERILASELLVDWKTYEETLNAL